MRKGDAEPIQRPPSTVVGGRAGGCDDPPGWAPDAMVEVEPDRWADEMAGESEVPYRLEAGYLL